MPRFASRKCTHDSKHPQFAPPASILHIAVLVCCALAQTATGQSTPGPQKSSKPAAVALYVGISHQLEQLRELSRRPDAQNLADRMWLHQRILEDVTAGSLQVDATVAQIDYEVSGVNALRSSLTDARDRKVNRLNLASLIVGGSLGALSGGLALNQRQAHNSTLAGISAGVLSSGLALAGIRAQQGSSEVLSIQSNMLAQVLGRPALPDSQYPQVVAAFLNQPVPEAVDGISRKARLISRWTAADRIDRFSAGKNDRIDRLTSQPSLAIRQSIDDLDNRAAMLADLRATISLMKQDLAGLLLSLPKAEAGMP